MSDVQLGDRLINHVSDPYVIAEIGVNHEGSMELARKLVRLAKDGGAHAAKFQTYKAHRLASRNSPAYWDLTKESTRSQFELFQKYDALDLEDYLSLAAYCDEVGIDFLSTPFDLESVDALAPHMSCFKVASADLTNVPLLRAVGKHGKPVLLSTGAATLAEVGLAVDDLRKADAGPIVLLHCVLNYPTSDDQAHIGMIRSLQRAFPELLIGYSDHTVPGAQLSALLLADVLGARVLEKHFTHDKSLPGNDHYHAMDAEDLRGFWRDLKQQRELLGPLLSKAPLTSEEPARANARRSIVLAHNVIAGEVMSEANLTTKRPGSGISPADWDKVVGRQSAAALSADHILQWTDLSEPPVVKPRVVAIVQARMGSHRFPGKMMANLAGWPLIEWILIRVRQARRVDEVVLATSTLPDDDVLAHTARRHAVTVVRGDETDVLSRFVKAADQSNADWIVRVCGDNPFTDPAEIDRLVEFFDRERPDYAFNHVAGLNNQYPDGFGAEILHRAMLATCDREGTDSRHREHVTLYVWDHAAAFRIATPAVPPDLAFPAMRFDIDLPGDLERLEPMARVIGIGGTAAAFVRAATVAKEC